MKQPSAPPLYPDLENESSNYRLQHISEIKTKLQNESQMRASLYKKYRRGINIIDGIDTGLISASFLFGIGGITALSTIIAAPVALGLEVVSLFCGLTGVVGKYLSRRLNIKAKKHDEINVLAQSKLNSIEDHVSKALIDNNISDEEFKLIMSELDKYQTMKEEIRSKAKKLQSKLKISEKERKELIEIGKKDAHAAILKKLDGNSQ